MARSGRTTLYPIAPPTVKTVMKTNLDDSHTSSNTEPLDQDSSALDSLSYTSMCCMPPQSLHTNCQYSLMFCVCVCVLSQGDTYWVILPLQG